MLEQIVLLKVVVEMVFLLGPIGGLHRGMERVIANAYADPLSAIAIVLGVVGIWRAEHLFKKLDNSLKHLIEDMKRNILREAVTVTTSYAAFTRALQVVELDPRELPKDAAFALLTAFRFQQLLNPAFKPEEFFALQKQTRNDIDQAAHGYIDMLIKSGLSKKTQ